ncbi:MAG: LTA synthase family protein [Thermodesulfobacteriota bacterium]|nr:LTA synthase family protein [Thermodesulfobacteriota bacterium]
MTFFCKLPKRLRFSALVVGITLIVFTGLRMAFWLTFHRANDPVSTETLVRSFFLGFKFDVRLSLLIVFPFLVFSWIPLLNPERSARGRRFWAGHFSILVPLIVLLYFIDFGQYAYLAERIDASALRYIENPLISFQMVWETYPVLWGISGLLAFGVFLYWVLKSLMPTCMAEKRGRLSKGKRALVVFLSIVVYLFGIYGKFSFYPLRWSDAFCTTHRFSSDLALNPVLFFLDTLCTAEESKYDEQAVKACYDRMATYVGVDTPDPGRLMFARRVNPTPLVEGEPNVVVILLESFSAHLTGIFGNPLNPSPNFDAIAKESLFFRRFYTPRHGTARAVFATLTGIPDVITHRTASRNPVIVSQYTILSAFENYGKFYFLGGSANWANIRGLFSHNVGGLRIYEEGDYHSPRIDTWGISDLHLFEEANRVLSSGHDKPFFAFIHTSGNHRPWSIPDDSRGFKMASEDEDNLTKVGFGSLEAFNSFRFLDHSLGFFMRIASEEKYFKNTLFFILGDNGTHGKMPHMPKAEEALKVGGYHVPFVAYGPGLIGEGKVYDNMASQIDVLPTIAGMIGLPCLNTTLGRNLFDARFDSQRYAFIQTKRGSVPEIGLLSDAFYSVMNADGTDVRLYPCDSETPTQEVGEKFPGRRKEMSQQCLGLYHTAKYLLYHNAPSSYVEYEE